MTEGLTFDANDHTYRFKGRLVPGVTSVLEQLQVLDGVTRDVLDAARDFGSNVHAACDLFNRDDLDIDALHPALVPYLNGWRRFLDETGFTVTASEQRVFSPKLFYAGTADAFGTMHGTTWVVDIKSGVVPDTVGPQLAAYQQAAIDRPRRRLCVQLLDGNYKLHECKDLGDFAIFQSALNLYRYRLQRKPANAHEFA